MCPGYRVIQSSPSKRACGYSGHKTSNKEELRVPRTEATANRDRGVPTGSLRSHGALCGQGTRYHFLNLIGGPEPGILQGTVLGDRTPAHSALTPPLVLPACRAPTPGTPEKHLRKSEAPS
ncbi:hypothetical protein P7K49_013199 [Saguinus oedipus]|uniref:Uncharacterized protein n=1 Tax=Saguinus oedipus TaxID=9490 RepID=A0ABQ9VF94_SAGOE|nr:hypothetical protein P7K49_013199 [Saguinus oedipus]